MANPNISNKKRLTILFYVALLLMLVIAGRLAQLMFFNAEDLQDKAENQWTRELAVAPKRGSILDRNGEILATSATAESVLLHPKDIKDAGEVASLLAPILEMEEQKIFDLANDKTKVEVWLKRQITSEQAEQIRQLNLSGVDFFTDTKRYYPSGEFMSQVLGYTSSDGDGQEGLEKYYNKYLAGYAGSILAQVDANGRTIAGSEQTYIDPQPGLNLVLTTDAFIQSFLESAAREALEVNQAKSVCAIVMNPKNGDILGMVNYPEADLNNLDRSDLQALADLSRNTAIVDAYEPGSTFKIITTAAALDSGAATTEDHFNCPGYKIVDGEKIKCWRSYNPHGDQTLAQAVENSCNPAFMEMALRMGTDKFYEYIYNFGFGSNTGVDYSADGAGIIRAAKYVKNVDLARIGFGQSIAVTPLQLSAAICATINGGYLYTPRLASHLQDDEGNIVKTFESQMVRQVISEETSAKMRTILEGVVANGGGKNGQIEGYRVGGKTGTAQMYENGVIVQGKNISSFVGFAPADDPQYMVLFIVREPGVPVTFGSVVAAPFAKEVLEKCLKYGGVEPTEPVEDLVETPDFVGKTTEEAAAAAQEAGLSLQTNGTGKIAAQSPAAGTKVKKGSEIDVYGETQSDPASDEKMPNLVGKTLAQAYDMLEEIGLEMEVDGDTGSGVIASQSQKEGTSVIYGEKVVVTCK
ncbi:PASTA domain-containing protein [Christensenellaceae bacterium NSJ-63]|uniref:PASTA domain-containing protein n=1 Tax=Guopingia tenuis TaxID=2763656 RepID=A0A926DHW4_9FIRM|nr:penicillin-binding transpeptidase domain-containing protein [Guopingia tenuis]MBC8538074.1 PASTA domain-containing protein [Guopingia tenuis]